MVLKYKDFPNFQKDRIGKKLSNFSPVCSQISCFLGNVVVLAVFLETFSVGHPYVWRWQFSNWTINVTMTLTSYHCGPHSARFGFWMAELFFDNMWFFPNFIHDRFLFDLFHTCHQSCLGFNLNLERLIQTFPLT